MISRPSLIKVGHIPFHSAPSNPIVFAISSTISIISAASTPYPGSSGCLVDARIITRVRITASSNVSSCRNGSLERVSKFTGSSVRVVNPDEGTHGHPEEIRSHHVSGSNSHSRSPLFASTNSRCRDARFVEMAKWSTGLSRPIHVSLFRSVTTRWVAGALL
jgi:hypothetical protein